MNENLTKLRTITGRVVSNGMDKTITVLVERVVRHRVYGKYIKRSNRFMVHDEGNVCQKGDIVAITSCRPISKRKTYRLVLILDTAER